MNTLPPTHSFLNGIELTLALDNGYYRGLERATWNGTTFLLAGRGTALPYAITPEGIAYSEFKIVSQTATGDIWELECEAIGRAAPIQQDVDVFSFPRLSPHGQKTYADRLTIRFKPRTITVAGEINEGFEVAYEWKSSERKIHWLYDSVALAPEGTAQGVRVMAQSMSASNGRIEHVLDLASDYSTAETYGTVCIQSPGRGGGSQIFDLVQGPQFAVTTFFESARSHGFILKANCEKAPGEDFVTVSDFQYGPLTQTFRSAPRIVVATRRASSVRHEALNRWTNWYEYTGKLWREELGLQRTRAVPTLTFEGTGAGGIDPGTTYPDLLKVWASRLDWVVENGFQAINLHTPEWKGAANEKTVTFGGNNCCPWEFKVSDLLGGDEGLRLFCEACHARNIKVFVWLAGHLHREAPIWKEHPEWAIRMANQGVWDGHYAVIHSLSFAHGAGEWILADLQALRTKTGIDGIWLDSFANLVHGPINFQSPLREPNGPAVFDFLGKLSQSGFEIMIEGMSQLGVSSWGNLKPAQISGQEELLLNSSLRYFVGRHWMGDPAVTREFYFRMLAARGPVGVWIEEFLGQPHAFPLALPNWFAPLTKAYNVVAPHMETRRLLVNGALWLDAKGKSSAFFAFTDGPLEETIAQQNAILTDLVTGKKFTCDQILTAGSIYQFQ